MPEAKPVDEEPRFEVAISFAGDNKRDKVRKVAELVREQLGEDTVFFDEFYEHEIPGQDADLYFQRVFYEQTTMVVSCVLFARITSFIEGKACYSLFSGFKSEILL